MSPSNSPPPPPPTRSTQILEVPSAPSSRFVLPPPPSDLMNRLQAFLPQIKSANEQLAAEDRMDDGQVEEPVVLEEISSSEDDDDSSDDSSSEEDSDDEEEEAAEQATRATGTEGQSLPQEGETMAHLLDISARPKVVKKKLQALDGAKQSGGAGIVEME